VTIAIAVERKLLLIQVSIPMSQLRKRFSNDFEEKLVLSLRLLIGRNQQRVLSLQSLSDQRYGSTIPMILVCPSPSEFCLIPTKSKLK